MRGVWTTHPGNLVERALQAGSPEDWRAPQVATYLDAGQIDPRRRHCLKILGDVPSDTYAVVSASIRRAFVTASECRELLASAYSKGTLVFVGFRQGDPDLAALLDRLFATLSPPERDHYFVGSGIGVVDADELSHEHRLQLIPLEGQGGDASAADALHGFLARLADTCAEAGITLSLAQPAEDDLETWTARLSEDPSDEQALGAMKAMFDSAESAGEVDRMVEILMARIEVAPGAEARAALLEQLADVYEKHAGDLPRAFTALTAALAENPASEHILDHAERMARETDGWGELVGDLAGMLPTLEDDALAARYWTRLGRWYSDQLGHHDYAVSSFREALKRDASQAAAREGLEHVYRTQQKWAELADTLGHHADSASTPEEKARVLLSLGDLQENQLGSTLRAIEAYEKACELDATGDDALAALERLYRRDERWAKLATVLERRARLVEASDATRAAALRSELGELRSERLGDLEGAITRHEQALAKDAGDVEALRGLEKLYERSGRTDDYLRTLEALAAVAPEHEQAALWRRFAVEIEDRPEGADRAITAYRAVLTREPGASDAFRSLGRLYRERGDWDQLAELLEQQLEIASEGTRGELWAQLGALYEEQLRDPHRAIECHEKLRARDADDRVALGALGRLYQRVENWEAAVDALGRHASLQGPDGAESWYEAGRVLAEHAGDAREAEDRLSRALELDPDHMPSMRALVGVYKQRQDWARAAQLMVEAADRTKHRLERVDLLFGAAQLHEQMLDRPEQSLALCERIITLDPEHAEAGQRVADSYVRAERWEEAEPLLDMLARKTDADDRLEKARHEALAGRAAAELGHPERAEKRFRAALDGDPACLDAAFGLGELLFEAKRWEEAETHYRGLLDMNRTALGDSQTVDVLARIGASARHQGRADAASQAFEAALELDPAHPGALSNVMALAAERGDHAAVVEAKRKSLESASDAERFQLLLEIGEVCHQELEDPVSALGAYLDAAALVPDSQKVLHRILDIYTQQREWRRAVESLDRLATVESDPETRAKYNYAAAVICRDELSALDEAVERFTRALDDEPTLPKAFGAIDRILGEQEDWRGLSRAYRKMLKRLGDRATDDQLLSLWSRLADINHEKLGDRDAARAALEVVAELDPSDTERRERLANLYLEAGTDAADKAATELQYLLKQHPDRMDLYHALSSLYSQTGAIDKAYCLASSLVFLGTATPEEKQLYQTRRPTSFTPARRRLTEELWQKNIIHASEDRALSGMFAQLGPSLAATTAQPREALDLHVRQRVEPETEASLLPRVFRYATHTLGLSPAPELYRAGEGLRAANLRDDERLVPALLAGVGVEDGPGEADLAFRLGRMLAYFRGDRYVYFALPTMAKLEAALIAALAASGVKNGISTPEVDELRAHLSKTVPRPVMEQVAVLARKLETNDGSIAVTSWVTGTDLTAARVGLILANDLEAAARVLATESGVASQLPVKARLRELLAYNSSEEYFEVRRHLGLEV